MMRFFRIHRVQYDLRGPKRAQNFVRVGCSHFNHFKKVLKVDEIHRSLKSLDELIPERKFQLFKRGAIKVEKGLRTGCCGVRTV